MTRGQETLTIDLGAAPRVDGAWTEGLSIGSIARGVPLIVIEPTTDELAAHREYLQTLEKEIKSRCVWSVWDMIGASVAMPDAA